MRPLPGGVGFLWVPAPDPSRSAFSSPAASSTAPAPNPETEQGPWLFARARGKGASVSEAVNQLCFAPPSSSQLCPQRLGDRGDSQLAE